MIEKNNFDSNFPKINASIRGRQLNFLDEINNKHNIIEECKLNLMKIGNPSNYYKLTKSKKSYDLVKEKKIKIVKTNLNFVKLKNKNNTQSIVLNPEKQNNSVREDSLKKNSKDKNRLNFLKKGILKKINEKTTINKSLFEFSTIKIKEGNTNESPKINSENKDNLTNLKSKTLSSSVDPKTNRSNESSVTNIFEKQFLLNKTPTIEKCTLDFVYNNNKILDIESINLLNESKKTNNNTNNGSGNSTELKKQNTINANLNNRRESLGKRPMFYNKLLKSRYFKDHISSNLDNNNNADNNTNNINNNNNSSKIDIGFKLNNEIKSQKSLKTDLNNEKDNLETIRENNETIDGDFFNKQPFKLNLPKEALISELTPKQIDNLKRLEINKLRAIIEQEYEKNRDGDYKEYIEKYNKLFQNHLKTRTDINSDYYYNEKVAKVFKVEEFRKIYKQCITSLLEQTEKNKVFDFEKHQLSKSLNKKKQFYKGFIEETVGEYSRIKDGEEFRVHKYNEERDFLNYSSKRDQLNHDIILKITPDVALKYGVEIANRYKFNYNTDAADDFILIDMFEKNVNHEIKSKVLDDFLIESKKDKTIFLNNLDYINGNTTKDRVNHILDVISLRNSKLEEKVTKKIDEIKEKNKKINPNRRKSSVFFSSVTSLNDLNKSSLNVNYNNNSNNKNNLQEIKVKSSVNLVDRKETVKEVREIKEVKEVKLSKVDVVDPNNNPNPNNDENEAVEVMEVKSKFHKLLLDSYTLLNDLYPTVIKYFFEFSSKQIDEVNKVINTELIDQTKQSKTQEILLYRLQLLENELVDKISSKLSGYSVTKRTKKNKFYN